MLENYEENPGTGKTRIQELVSLLPSQYNYSIKKLNICSISFSVGLENDII